MAVASASEVLYFVPAEVTFTGWGTNHEEGQQISKTVLLKATDDAPLSSASVRQPQLPVFGISGETEMVSLPPGSMKRLKVEFTVPGPLGIETVDGDYVSNFSEEIVVETSSGHCATLNIRAAWHPDGCPEEEYVAFASRSHSPEGTELPSAQSIHDDEYLSANAKQPHQTPSQEHAAQGHTVGDQVGSLESASSIVQNDQAGGGYAVLGPERSQAPRMDWDPSELEFYKSVLTNPRSARKDGSSVQPVGDGLDDVRQSVQRLEMRDEEGKWDKNELGFYADLLKQSLPESSDSFETHNQEATSQSGASGKIANRQLNTLQSNDEYDVYDVDNKNDYVDASVGFGSRLAVDSSVLDDEEGVFVLDGRRYNARGDDLGPASPSPLRNKQNAKLQATLSVAASQEGLGISDSHHTLAQATLGKGSSPVKAPLMPSGLLAPTTRSAALDEEEALAAEAADSSVSIRGPGAASLSTVPTQKPAKGPRYLQVLAGQMDGQISSQMNAGKRTTAGARSVPRASARAKVAQAGSTKQFSSDIEQEYKKRLVATKKAAHTAGTAKALAIHRHKALESKIAQHTREAEESAAKRRVEEKKLINEQEKKFQDAWDAL